MHFCSNYWLCDICSLGCNKDSAVDAAWCHLPQLQHYEAGDYKGSQGSSSSDESIQCTSPSAGLASANWQRYGVCQILVRRLQIQRQLPRWCVSVLCGCWWGIANLISDICMLLRNLNNEFVGLSMFFFCFVWCICYCRDVINIVSLLVI